LQKCDLQHHQISIDSLAIGRIGFFCQYSTGAKREAVDGAGGGTGNLQGSERGLGAAGWMRPCSGEKKIARRWQDILPNLRSISYAHQ
jgi:hypothetical protein